MEEPESSARIELRHLPADVLRIIFESVRPKELLENGALVCKRFNNIISDEDWWMRRLMKTLGPRNALPRVELESTFFNAARTMDGVFHEHRRWKRFVDEEPIMTSLITNHNATVDCVKLFRSCNGANLCITGARDRNLKLWNMDKIKTEAESVSSWLRAERVNAHSGWIWTIDFNRDKSKMLTGSWDTAVALWDMGERPLTQICKREPERLDGAATCLIVDDNVVYCSKFNSKIVVYDIRAQLDKMLEIPVNTKPVVKIVKKDNSLFVGGTERLGIYDVRFPKKTCISSTTLESCLSMDSGPGLVYVSTAHGQVHAFDDVWLQRVHSIQAATNSNVARQVIRTPGSVLVLTKVEGLKIFSLGSSPSLLAHFNVFQCEPCHFDVSDGSIAVGCGDGGVMFWHAPDDY